jgi:acyl carrier protein
VSQPVESLNTVKNVADDTTGDKVNRIMSFIAQKLRIGAENLRPEYTLDELGLDSLTSAEVVLGVEKLYGLRLNFEAASAAIDRHTTLSTFVELIASLIESARCPS